MKKLLLVVLLLAFGAQAQVHKFGALDTANTWTGPNTYSGTFDASGASAARPFRLVTLATIPGTCSANKDAIYVTDAAVGSKSRVCNSLGTGFDSLGGAGGTPAGSSGQLQYNASSSFGGASNTFYDNANSTLLMKGNLYIGYNSSYSPASAGLNPQIQIHADAVDVGSMFDAYSSDDKTVFSVLPAATLGGFTGTAGATYHSAILLGSADTRPATPGASLVGAVIWADVFSPGTGVGENVSAYNRNADDSKSWKNFLLATPTVNDAAVDLLSVANGACTTERTVAVTGAAFGDDVAVTAGTALQASTFLTGKVTSAGNTKWQFCNLSGGAVDRASDTYVVKVLRK